MFFTRFRGPRQLEALARFFLWPGSRDLAGLMGPSTQVQAQPLDIQGECYGNATRPLNPCNLIVFWIIHVKLKVD